MSRSLNDIIKRSGFGEKMGIRIRKPRRSRANVYKNNIEYKTLSVSMENYSLKSTINEVIDYKKKVPRKEDVGKFVDDVVSNIQKFVDMIIRWVEKGIAFIERAWDKFVGNDIEDNLERLTNPDATYKVSGILTDESAFNSFVNHMKEVTLSIGEVEKELIDLISPGGVRIKTSKENTKKFLIHAIKYIKKHDGPGNESSDIAKKLNGGLVMKLREAKSIVAAKGTVDVQNDPSLKEASVSRSKHLGNLLNDVYKLMRRIKQSYVDISEAYINDIKDVSQETKKKLIKENESSLIGFTRLLTEDIIKGWNIATKEFSSLMSLVSVKTYKRKRGGKKQ